MRPLAVYIHIPFCVKKCAYCDFASFAGCETRMDAYFDALWDEIETASDALQACTVRSVFIGGGTPSYAPAGKLARTLERLRAKTRFFEDTEITIEANPGTLTAEKLRVYREAGVNRVSIGAQSFDEAELRFLGRIHSPRQAIEAVEQTRAAGFENISIDLMYALPGQTKKTWKRTLETAVGLPITHISAYSLIVEPGTEMARRVESGMSAIPDEETVNSMQRLCTRMLREAGFARYEISNYAQPGFESRHNLTYWQGGEYLGFGSAAHSLFENARFSNPPEMENYISGVRKVEYSPRTTEDAMEERLMLETRMTRGLDLAAWRRSFGREFAPRSLQKLRECGLVEITDGCLRLTESGLEVQDAVVLELLDAR